MQLLEVERVNPDVREALLGVLANIVGKEDVIELVLGTRRPLAILGGNLRGDVEPLPPMAPERFTQQPFAVTVPIRPGRIEEIASELDGPVERRKRLAILAAGPARHAPHAIAALGDGPSSSGEFSI